MLKPKQEDKKLEAEDLIKQQLRRLKKYYYSNTNTVPPTELLSTYLQEIEKGGEKQRGLIQKLKAQLKNNEFKEYLGFGTLLGCCTKKTPCPELTDDQLHTIILTRLALKDKEGKLLNTTGECPSCGVKLTMFKKAKIQRLSTWNLVNFNLTHCKSLMNNDISNFTILCNGCVALCELCYYDKGIFQKYIDILFNRKSLTSQANYYFQVSGIPDDGKKAKIKMPTFKKCPGLKKDRQWLLQSGLCVYKLTNQLFQELKSDESRNNFLNMQHRENILDASLSKILVKEDIVEDKSKKEPSPISKMELYRNRPNYVVFGIPIDPKQRTNKFNLLGVVINDSMELDKKPEKVEKKKVDDSDEDVDEDEDVPINDTYLFTNQVLKKLSMKFPYEDFLRWGLDQFRIIIPKFTFENEEKPKGWSQDEQKILQQFKTLNNETTALNLKLKTLREETKAKNKDKTKLLNNLRSKLIDLVDKNNKSDAVLKQLQLVPEVKTRSVSRFKISKEYIGKNLPDLLLESGVIKTRTKDIDEACIAIASSLFDSIPSRKQTTFSLKIYDEKEEKKSKTKK